MLHQNRTIKKIVLSSNRITTVGAKALLEALRVNKVVTYISLNDNGEISKEVRTEIWEIVTANVVAAYVLTLNESVTEINLRCKEFGAEGMKVLTAALKENKQVTKINLERCIGDVGAQALAEMLHQNRTIKKIVLSSNRITTVGAKALLEALRVNKVVTYISLNDNGEISEEVKKEIEEVLEAQVEEEGEVFDFSMQKSGGGLGFDACCRRAYIVVTEIFDDGDVVETNNAIAEPTNRLKAGDFIVDVNGIKGDSDAMARKFDDLQEVKMTIKRIHN
ncbi:unnamed protein product [Durusdinium trenchii]|uniref:PDZ domain-containing protein n=2 Tax=Durusdinium trenchii TaxID=1381693 RepID=A0ABP0LLE6_9DINO